MDFSPNDIGSSELASLNSNQYFGFFRPSEQGSSSGFLELSTWKDGIDHNPLRVSISDIATDRLLFADRLISASSYLGVQVNIFFVEPDGKEIEGNARVGESPGAQTDLPVILQVCNLPNGTTILPWSIGGPGINSSDFSDIALPPDSTNSFGEGIISTVSTTFQKSPDRPLEASIAFKYENVWPGSLFTGPIGIVRIKADQATEGEEVAAISLRLNDNQEFKATFVIADTSVALPTNGGRRPGASPRPGSSPRPGRPRSVSSIYADLKTDGIFIDRVLSPETYDAIIGYI